MAAFTVNRTLRPTDYFHFCSLIAYMNQVSDITCEPLVCLKE